MTILLIVIAAITALTLIFLLIISPSDRKHKDVDLLNGAYIAHRGLHNKEAGVPENSLLSFQKAIERGYAIEIDIHLTKDGKVVVYHDHKLERGCGVKGRVEEKTLEELKSYRLFGTKEKIPTLEETLKAVNGNVFLLIEYKAKKNSKALCNAADKILSDYKGKYFIQSFYPQVLFWYRFHNRKVCRGLLGADFRDKGPVKRMAGNMVFNFIARPDFIAYRHTDAKNPMRRFACWLGAERLGWTFTSQEDLNAGKKYFSGYIFEQFIPEKK
ncbi:MAG: glycerophosphodiester phosphodiesterase [Clostridia bacterium]|nr:glycerophosphodiester phosphodiesterase [Clostridia bacterium]